MAVVVNKQGEISDMPDYVTLRSSDAQEFLSKKPSWITRWGISIFFLLLAGLGLICWFIRYPVIVPAKARLIGVHAPKEVICRTTGKIEKLLLKEGDAVQAGAVIGFMESTANPVAIEQARLNVDKMLLLIIQNNNNELLHLFPQYTSHQYLNQLGEMQQHYQQFIQAFLTYQDYAGNGFYLRKKTMLQQDIVHLKDLLLILQQQKILLEQDLALSDENFNASESLAKDKVISSLDFRNEKSKLIAKKLSLPQVNSAIVSNEVLQNDKRKEIAELENQVQVQKNSFVQALQTFRSQLEQWEQKYVLKAPVTGKVSFAGFFQEDQQVKEGQLLLYVQPANSSYSVEMMLPQYNSGQVKTGQQVLLKFQAYPFEQFGKVTGTIDHISTMPADSGFLARVALPAGLTTNYNRQLAWQNGLLADAEIITDDLRLLQRFYNNIRLQLQR